MTAFAILAWLTTLAAIFSWVNYKYIRMPATIGLMVISLVFSLGMINPAAIYVVVSFSIIVQGLTVRPVAARLTARQP